MKKLFVSLFAVAWISSSVAANPEEGKPHYATCITCHGAQGEGNEALQAPAIAGLSEEYLIRQLNHFKSGVRGANPEDTAGMQMAAMANTLKADGLVELVAAYIAAMPVTWAAVPEQADLGNGNNYYEALCGACHGGKAEGNDKLKAPRLAGLSITYMKRQYANLKSGVRGDHPEDRYGKRMKYMTNSLPSDKDLDDVLAYIVSQRPAE